MKLFDALFDNDLKTVREYLASGDVNIQNEKGQSLLQCAIAVGNNELFNLLLSTYININSKDLFGDTALHYCVNYKKMGYLKTLLKSNATFSKNNNGETPLFRAAALGIEDMVYLFCETMSLNLSEQNEYGLTMFNALIKGRCFNVLREITPDLSIVKINDYNLNNSLNIAVLTDNIDIVNYILSSGIWVNYKNKEGKTALHLACKLQNKEIIKALFKAGANPDIIDKSGHKPRYYLDDSNVDYFDSMIKLNKIDDYIRKYPIHYFVQCEDILSIKKHFNPLILDKRDDKGLKAYDYAIIVNNNEIFSLFNKKIKK